MGLELLSAYRGEAYRGEEIVTKGRHCVAVAHAENALCCGRVSGCLDFWAKKGIKTEQGTNKK